jgi:hypothetical protein
MNESNKKPHFTIFYDMVASFEVIKLFQRFFMSNISIDSLLRKSGVSFARVLKATTNDNLGTQEKKKAILIKFRSSYNEVAKRTGRKPTSIQMTSLLKKLSCELLTGYTKLNKIVEFSLPEAYSFSADKLAEAVEKRGLKARKTRL